MRFHHGERGRGGNYSASELDAWPSASGRSSMSSSNVYAYFNDDWKAYAPGNALGLRQRL